MTRQRFERCWAGWMRRFRITTLTGRRSICDAGLRSWTTSGVNQTAFAEVHPRGDVSLYFSKDCFDPTGETIINDKIGNASTLVSPHKSRCTKGNLPNRHFYNSLSNLLTLFPFAMDGEWKACGRPVHKPCGVLLTWFLLNYYSIVLSHIV